MHLIIVHSYFHPKLVHIILLTPQISSSPYATYFHQNDSQQPPKATTEPHKNKPANGKPKISNPTKPCRCPTSPFKLKAPPIVVPDSNRRSNFVVLTSLCHRNTLHSLPITAVVLEAIQGVKVNPVPVPLSDAGSHMHSLLNLLNLNLIYYAVT